MMAFMEMVDAEMSKQWFVYDFRYSRFILDRSYEYEQ